MCFAHFLYLWTIYSEMYARHIKYGLITQAEELGFINLHLNNIRFFNTVTKTNKLINK